MAYSIDFIKMAVSYKQKGYTFEQLREAFGISSATYYDWEEKLENGHYDKKVKQERNRKIDKEKLKRAVEEKPDSFLRELAKLFDCTPTAIFYALERLGITLKKRHLPIMRKVMRNGKSLQRS